MSPKVDWENVCDEILGKGGQATEYVYLGTEKGKMGEKDISGRFRKFSVSNLCKCRFFCNDDLLQ